MVVVPAVAAAVTTPVVRPMDPADRLVLLHVPPPVASFNVVEPFTQVDNVPPIGVGDAYTVIM